MMVVLGEDPRHRGVGNAKRSYVSLFTISNRSMAVYNSHVIPTGVTSIRPRSYVSRFTSSNRSMAVSNSNIIPQTPSGQSIPMAFTFKSTSPGFNASWGNVMPQRWFHPVTRSFPSLVNSLTMSPSGCFAILQPNGWSSCSRHTSSVKYRLDGVGAATRGPQSNHMAALLPDMDMMG